MTMEQLRALIRKHDALTHVKTGGAGRTKENVRKDIKDAWGRG